MAAYASSALSFFLFACSLLPGNYDDYDDERVVVRFARPPLANCSIFASLPLPLCATVAIADCQHDNDNHHNCRDVAILRNLLDQSQTQAIVCIFFAVSVGATHVNHLMRTLAIRVSKN